jgi:hypothetical protein
MKKIIYSIFPLAVMGAIGFAFIMAPVTRGKCAWKSAVAVCQVKEGSRFLPQSGRNFYPVSVNHESYISHSSKSGSKTLYEIQLVDKAGNTEVVARSIEKPSLAIALNNVEDRLKKRSGTYEWTDATFGWMFLLLMLPPLLFILILFSGDSEWQAK